MPPKPDFIGAEVLIASLFINKSQWNAGFAEINRYGICVRKLSFNRKMETVFFTSKDDVETAARDYCDYFDILCDRDGSFSGVAMADGIGLERLKKKFIDPLPDDVISVLDDAYAKFQSYICSQGGYAENS